jgi:hypothetical protein
MKNKTEEDSKEPSLTGRVELPLTEVGKAVAGLWEENKSPVWDVILDVPNLRCLLDTQG